MYGINVQSQDQDGDERARNLGDTKRRHDHCFDGYECQSVFCVLLQLASRGEKWRRDESVRKEGVGDVLIARTTVTRLMVCRRNVQPDLELVHRSDSDVARPPSQSSGFS